MGVREVVLRCGHKGCNTVVARGQLTDNTWVWEIRLDNSVTDAGALSNGMGIGNFNGAKSKIKHELDGGGKVKHVIR